MTNATLTTEQIAALDKYGADYRSATHRRGSLEQAIAALSRLRQARSHLTLPEVIALDMAAGRGLSPESLADAGPIAPSTIAELITRASRRLVEHYGIASQGPRIATRLLAAAPGSPNDQLVIFRDFIDNSVVTDDPEGEFVRTAREDAALTSVSTWAQLRTRLQEQGAAELAVAAARNVWNEFEVRAKLRLQEFVRGSIRSVWSLELLLLMKRAAERAWTSGELAAELRVSAPLASDVLTTFEASGLIRSEADGRWRYAPAIPVIAELADELERLYRERPQAVVKTIVSAPNDQLTGFADAFRFRGDAGRCP